MTRIPQRQLLALFCLLLGQPAAIAQEDHAGLLGHRYADVQFVYGRAFDPPTGVEFDDRMGARFSLNLPATWFEVVGLRLDLNAEITTAGFDARVTQTPGTVESDITNWNARANIWYDGAHGLRPYLSIGVDQFDANIAAAGLVSNTTADTSLALFAGVEKDISSRTAFRATLLIETEESMKNSEILAEVVFRPNKDFFVRMGALLPLEADGIIGLVGGGIDF